MSAAAASAARSLAARRAAAGSGRGPPLPRRAIDAWPHAPNRALHSTAQASAFTSRRAAPSPLLRACLEFRQRRKRLAAAEAAAASPPPSPADPASSSSSSSSSSPLASSSASVEAVRMAASAGLRRGLRTAAAAAAAAATAAAAASSSSSSSSSAADGAQQAAGASPSLEGRLLPSYLLAAPPSSAGAGEGGGEPFLLRLMEQRFALGGAAAAGAGAGGGIGGGAVITVVTPHDVDAIFDALQARGCDDGDPYWARVWPSAVALAECVLARPELVRGRRVADVGAGLGVAGLAAALAGAREVALLDREPLALECARLSAEATAAAAAAGAGSSDGGQQPLFDVARPAAAAAAAAEAAAPAVPVVDAMGRRALTSIGEVLGGAAAQGDGDRRAAAPGRPLVRAEPFDWHARPLPRSLRASFDVVLACDVLYERDAVAPLAEVVPLLLAPGGPGRLLLADPPARTAENRERFLELLASAKGSRSRRRFAVDEVSLEQCAPRQLDRELLGGQADGRAVPVQLLHLRAVDGNDTVGVKGGGF